MNYSVFTQVFFLWLLQVIVNLLFGYFLSKKYLKSYKTIALICISIIVFIPVSRMLIFFITVVKSISIADNVSIGFQGNPLLFMLLNFIVLLGTQLMFNFFILNRINKLKDQKA
ncbi:MAG: hypothetical protein HC830_06835 [Bacteroidetes bacterium]|nr:hypothetical protein [Bacteroidota bacterium]